jgi:metallo-beta-lactamase class B
MRSLLFLVFLSIATSGSAQTVDWSATRDFYCTPGKAHANNADDPLIAPTKIFDNLYAIGRTSTVVYALTTSDGIVLIDAGYPDQLDTVLLPGLKELGLDASRVKYILVTHGHADHFGGSAALQQRYGAKVGMAAADWETVERPGRGGTPSTGPKRDLVLAEGTPLKVGDTEITVVAVPGHTPGSLGFIFPVKDGRATHTAALFGGAILLPGRQDVPGLQGYINSVNHFADVTKRRGVDVEVQNHPIFDGMDVKLAALKARRNGQPHPFVVGKDGYQQLLSTMTTCMQEEIKRR